MKVRALVGRAVAVLLVSALALLGGTAPASATIGPLGNLFNLLTIGSTTNPDLVVKVDVAHGYSISSVVDKYHLRMKSAILGSRGIYLVSATQDDSNVGILTLHDLLDKLDDDPAVVYAETNVTATLNTSRMHGWPQGTPTIGSYTADDYTAQLAAAGIDAKTRALSTGKGQVVAVLDTGIDDTHPALAGRIKGGWDYVDDDADPTDPPANDEGSPIYKAYGHGTFVAGLVALMAPDATIMPERVLDGDGNGNIFVIAQAILDAVDQGATVINLSFGTDNNTRSALLDDALTTAHKKGVVVVASAGNQSSGQALYPSNGPFVLSVTALDSSAGQVAPYADYGVSVDVAAWGTSVVGPIPGNRYAAWSGTSMAAPVVAGQVALIRAKAPRLNADQQVQAIELSSRRLWGWRFVAYGAVDIRASLDWAR